MYKHRNLFGPSPANDYPKLPSIPPDGTQPQVWRLPAPKPAAPGSLLPPHRRKS